MCVWMLMDFFYLKFSSQVTINYSEFDLFTSFVGLLWYFFVLNTCLKINQIKISIKIWVNLHIQHKEKKLYLLIILIII